MSLENKFNFSLDLNRPGEPVQPTTPAGPGSFGRPPRIEDGEFDPTLLYLALAALAVGIAFAARNRMATARA